MKDDLRQAKEAVKALRKVGEKEWYISQCDLDARDIDILRRVWVRRQSRIEIANALNMSPESVHQHYREAMLVLYQIIGELKSQQIKF